MRSYHPYFHMSLPYVAEANRVLMYLCNQDLWKFQILRDRSAKKFLAHSIHLPGPRNGVFASCHDLRSPFPTVTTNDLGATSDSRRSSVCAPTFTPPPPGKLTIPYTRGIQPVKHIQLSFFPCAEKLRARYQGFTRHGLNTCTNAAAA